MLDTVHHVETPEGVDLELRLAGPLPRFYAFLIDLLIRAGILLAVATPLGVLGQGGIGVMLMLMFGLEWLYPVILEVLDSGRTPGKRALGLRVVRYDGTPLEWTSSVIRNLLRTADMLPFPYVAGLLCMLLSGSFRRLGDLAAGTVVIYDHAPEGGAIAAAAAPVPPPVPLTVEEQRAVVGFAERAARLSPARAHELALLATPLVVHAGREGPVARLRGVAAWLSGRRPGESAT